MKYCPGALTEGYHSYSPSCLRNMFNCKKVNPVLPYFSPQKSEETAELFVENRKRISISDKRGYYLMFQRKQNFLNEK